MSNAAVINATSTSGQTAGTPISIETGGDVVLKAYGTGSGNWFVVMAFAPVVNGVTGAPVTLTIDYNQPGRQTSAVGTSATEWVGWVLGQGGTWQASGIVEGYQPGEALSDDLGTFARFDALPQYGVKSGARASVAGVQYTYGAGGWKAGGDGSSILPCFDTIAARDAAYPAPSLGRNVRIKRLCGNGYFEQMYNGVRWESFGSIIRDAGLNSVGYPLVAPSASYVVLASYVIPPGLVGDGEEWEISSRWKNNGIKTADAYPELRIGAFSVGGSVPSINGVNFSARTRAAIVRLGSILECRQAGTNTDLYAGGAIQDRATDMSIAQTVYAGINPGAAGDTYTLRHWALTRIA